MDYIIAARRSVIRCSLPLVLSDIAIIIWCVMAFLAGQMIIAIGLVIIAIVVALCVSIVYREIWYFASVAEDWKNVSTSLHQIHKTEIINKKIQDLYDEE